MQKAGSLILQALTKGLVSLDDLKDFAELGMAYRSHPIVLGVKTGHKRATIRGALGLTHEAVRVLLSNEKVSTGTNGVIL